MSDIKAVESFWNNNPLFVGKSQHRGGTLSFFEEHHDVYVKDCFAGKIDERCFPVNREFVLDLGCGVGFWTIELAKRYPKVMAADLTENALTLTKKRADLYNQKNIFFEKQNAECLTFNNAIFDHINCQGVIHHTPDTERCIAEMSRVLKSNGTVSLSVYYKNVFLRNWKMLSKIGKILYGLGAKLGGRGREKIFLQNDLNELVRLYDGGKNPIGKAYTRSEFFRIVKPYFHIKESFLHFFPLRAMPFTLPNSAHRFLDKKLGFMLYLSLIKK